MLNKLKEKRINRYIRKLKENSFNQIEINILSSIYKKILNLSNILIINISMFIISIILIVISIYVKDTFFLENKKIIIWIFTTISSILALISFIITIWLLVNLLTCKIKEVRKWVLIWAILSLIPGISFIFLFVAKFQMSHIYWYRK